MSDWNQKKDWHPERDWIVPGQIVDGTHYKLTGNLESKDIICCVHGIGSYHTCFNQLAEALANAGYKVIQYDLIGRGFSHNHKSETFGADAHIDQLHHLLTDTLKIDAPFHFVAHSMGGALVALYTAKYPNLVKSLTLLSPAGLMNSGPLPLIRNWCCLAGMVRNMLDKDSSNESAWRNDFFHHDGLIYTERLEKMMQSQRLQRKYSLGSFNAFFQSVLQFPLYGLDDTVKSVAQNENLSVHIIWAKEDKAVPIKPSYTRWMKTLAAGKLKSTSSTVLEQAAHGFLLEYPDETHADILKFLETQRSSNNENAM